MLKLSDKKSVPERLLLLLSVLASLFLLYRFSFSQEDLFLRMRVLRYKEPLPARNFEVVDLEGNSIHLSQFRGKVILLNFWATWCGPCKKEMVPMEALYQQCKDSGFIVLAVSLDQGGVKVVKAFVEKRGLTFPVLIDTSGKAKSTYRITSLPTTFLIDRDGRLLGKSLGPRDWASEGAVALVESLLARSH